MKSPFERRRFVLAESWTISVEDGEGYPDGIIFIPKGFVTDGVSIPFPWFMTFMTFGALRPVGIMFEAAIAHDYAYSHGNLIYGHGIEPISQAQADVLFRDMVATKNPTVALLAWWGIKIWNRVKK